MSIKRLLRLGLASALSVSSLLVISVPSALAAGPFTCTWTGGGVNSNFSTAANWSGCNGTSPQAGDNDSLIFPEGAANLFPINDLSSASFTNITFSGSAVSNGYDLTGNAMNVGGNINDTSTVSGVSNIIDANITLTLSSGATISSDNQTLIIGNSNSPATDTLALGSTNSDVGANVTVYSNVTGTNRLNLVGTVHFGADNGFSGTVALAGTLYADSANVFAAASIINTVGSPGAIVAGNGNLGNNLDIGSGVTVAPGDPAPGCLSSTNLTMAGTYQAVLGGTTACTGYDQLTTSGTTDVTGGTLQVSLANGFIPTVGQTFTIINNTGGSAVTSTFSGLAEGSTFTGGGYTFKISYVGGDGNDVVLTVASVAGGATSAPKTPNTGLALIKVHPLESLVFSIAATLMILAVARQIKPVKH